MPPVPTRGNIHLSSHDYDAGFLSSMVHDAGFPYSTTGDLSGPICIVPTIPTYDSCRGSTILLAGAPRAPPTGNTEFLAAKTETQLEFGFAKEVSNPNVTYLYQKVGAQGEHLKFGITDNPATRYSAAELNGGRLRIIGQGERSELLGLERQLHETLPIGPEERQLFYIQKQIEKGLKPPPY